MAKLKIKDISLKDYITLDLEELTTYQYYLEYGNLNAEDTLNIGSFFDCSFGFVKDMQYYCSQGLTWNLFIETISNHIGLSQKEIAKKSIFLLQKARLYCIKEVEKINKIEVDFLGHDTTPEEDQSDISRFSAYGSFIQFEKLAGGDLLKIEDIKKLKYDFCFTKLKLDADRDNFSKDYNEVMLMKNKR